MRARDLPNWTPISIPALGKVAYQAFRTGTGFMTCVSPNGKTHYIPENTEVIPLTPQVYKNMDFLEIDKDYETIETAAEVGTGD